MGDGREDLLTATATGGFDRLAGAVVEFLDRVCIEFADHAHGVDAHGEDAGRRAQPEHTQEHDGQHKVRDRAGQDDQRAGSALRETTPRGGLRGSQSQWDGQHYGQERGQEHDGQGLEDQTHRLGHRREVEGEHPLDEGDTVVQ